MDKNFTFIFNSSKDTTISVKLTPPEEAITPQVSSIDIHPNTKEKLFTKGGSMNLFIWKKDNRELIWKGIVPTKIDKSLVVFPEEKKVFYEGIELPDNFQPSTSFEGPGFSISSGERNIYTYFILSLMIVLIILGFLWYGGYLSFLKKGKSS